MRLDGERAAPLIRRTAAAIDTRSSGLVFALIGLGIAVLLLGVMPTALAIGLLALLVVD